MLSSCVTPNAKKEIENLLMYNEEYQKENKFILKHNSALQRQVQKMRMENAQIKIENLTLKIYIDKVHARQDKKKAKTKGI